MFKNKRIYNRFDQGTPGVRVVGTSGRDYGTYDTKDEAIDKAIQLDMPIWQGSLKPLEVVYDPQRDQRTVEPPQTFIDINGNELPVNPIGDMFDAIGTMLANKRAEDNVEEQGRRNRAADKGTHAMSVYEGDQRARELTPSLWELTGEGTVVPAMNFMSPSQQVGALIDMNQGEGYWQSIFNGNSGIVSDNFMRNHPVLGMTANLGLDAATYWAGNKAYNYMFGPYNTSLKNDIRRFKNLRSYYHSKPNVYSTGNLYIDNAENIVENYRMKFGTPKGTTKGRIRGLKQELENLDKDIKSGYLSDPEFKSYIEQNPSKYFDEAPEYAYFCFKEGLDPNDVISARKFINRQETSIRSVHSLSAEEAEKAGTIAYRERPEAMRGGDQITSRGGLYTSNSGSLNGNDFIMVDGKPTLKVGNRFSLPLDSGGEGNIMLLHTDFGVDPNASPLDQIRQFKNRSIDYDLMRAPRLEPATKPSGLRLRLKKSGDLFDSSNSTNLKGYDAFPENPTGYDIKLADDNILAIQHPYMSPSVYERVLVTNENKKKVAEILNRKHVKSDGPRTDRWTGVSMDYNDNLFLPYRPSYDYKTLLHYSRLRDRTTYKYHNDNTLTFRDEVFNRVDSRNNLRQSLHNKKRKAANFYFDRLPRALGVSSVVGTPFLMGYGAIQLGKYKEKNYWDSLSDEEILDYYRKYGNGERYIDEYIEDRFGKKD